MSKRVEVHEWSMAVTGAEGTRIRKEDGDLHGEVLTPHGIVSVYSDATFSSCEIVIAGRLYSRTEQRARTKRGLTIMAGRFAADLARKAGQR